MGSDDVLREGAEETSRGSRGLGTLAWTPRRSKDDVQFMQRGQSISETTESHDIELLVWYVSRDGVRVGVHDAEYRTVTL